MQVRSANAIGDLGTLAQTLIHSGKVTNNGFFVRLEINEAILSIFRDGRVVVQARQIRWKPKIYWQNAWGVATAFKGPILTLASLAAKRKTPFIAAFFHSTYCQSQKQMRYEFRLAELLGHTPDRRKRPGNDYRQLFEYTGLDRHQVASLLKNEPSTFRSRRSRDCATTWWNMDTPQPTRCLVPCSQLKPEHFWELLARRRKLEICLGVRRPDSEDAKETPWVVAIRRSAAR